MADEASRWRDRLAACAPEVPALPVAFPLVVAGFRVELVERGTG